MSDAAVAGPGGLAIVSPDASPWPALNALKTDVLAILLNKSIFSEI